MPVRKTHTVLVLSGPRGDTPTTNANFERIRAGIELAYALSTFATNDDSVDASCPVLVSGHPGERYLLQAEVEQMCLETGIGPKLRMNYSAKHTVANAFFGLTEAERQMKRYWKRHHEQDQELVIHVVTSAWHLPRVQTIFLGLLELYKRWDPGWWTTSCVLEFHAAPVETESTFAAEWAAEEKRKLAETHRFLRGWRYSRHRFQHQVREIRRQLAEPLPPPLKPSLLDSANRPADLDDPSDHSYELALIT